MKITNRLFILLVFSIATACENNNMATVPSQDMQIETRLHVIDSDNGKPVTEINYGKPVRFVFELINRGSSMVSLTFPSSKQYDFEVSDSDKQLVWNWSFDQLFTQAETTITLEAEGKIKFTPLWNQQDNQGKQVVPGTYKVTGLMAVPVSENQSLTFTIQKPAHTDIDTAELLVAPESIVIGSNTLELETYLWRDFMPISPPDGKPLIAIIKIIDLNKQAIPPELTAERLWVINGKDVWSTPFSNETRPDNVNNIIERVARNGPKWGPGINVDVIVGFRIGNENLLLLKASDQKINRTD